MRLATVFSGIGAPEYALERLLGKDNVQIVFACDCGECKLRDKKSKDPLLPEEVKYLESIKDDAFRQQETKRIYSSLRKRHWVRETYQNNYRITEDRWHDDIRFINGKAYRGQVDLFIGGSPCQSFSNMGHQGGLEDARGTLFYSFAKLVRDIQPKAFIFENVPGMLTNNKGETWKTILSIFESLDYKIVFKEILNSMDFGIPQNRRRLFVVGIKDEQKAALFVAPQKIKLKRYAAAFHDSNVPAKYYLGLLGFNFTTTNTARARINMDIIRTEKKNQQFNWNGDFIFEPIAAVQNRPDVLARAYVGQYNGQTGVVRKMTPAECHKLMGFDVRDFSVCENDTEAYKQSGNSIVVNVMEALIKSVIDTGAIQ